MEVLQFEVILSLAGVALRGESEECIKQVIKTQAWGSTLALKYKVDDMRNAQQGLLCRWPHKSFNVFVIIK